VQGTEETWGRKNRVMEEFRHRAVSQFLGVISLHIIMINKCSNIRWTGHAAHIGMRRNSQRILTGKTDRE
jgi:hypothetical protein